MTMQKMHFSGLESSSHLMPLGQLVSLRPGFAVQSGFGNFNWRSHGRLTLLPAGFRIMNLFARPAIWESPWSGSLAAN